MNTDIRLLEVVPEFHDLKMRTPLKFGGNVVYAITSLTVKVVVENRNGNTGTGVGNILLSDIWGFPSKVLSHEARDEAMRIVAQKACGFLEGSREYMHPLDFFFLMQKGLENLCREAERELALDERIPVLAALVSISPIDAAIHDAFGKANGICSYDGYGKEFMEKDLSFYLGAGYKGKYIGNYLRRNYNGKLPIFHLIGGLDKLTRMEKGPGDCLDGLPVSLDEWIEKDGLFCFKIKLSGSDIKWDVERTADCAAVISEELARRRKDSFYVTIDSNEMNESPETVAEYLIKLKEKSQKAFDALLYAEQPVERDLSKQSFDMHRVASIKPVLADESVTGIDKVDIIKELGWSGLALKTCKCHSEALLCMAKASEEGLVYSVQDLTNVGYGLLHSAGFAARTSPVLGVEYNSRQYIPDAFESVRYTYKECFEVKGGYISTANFKNIGLY